MLVRRVLAEGKRKVISEEDELKAASGNNIYIGGGFQWIYKLEIISTSMKCIVQNYSAAQKFSD